MLFAAVLKHAKVKVYGVLAAIITNEQVFTDTWEIGV